MTIWMGCFFIGKAKPNTPQMSESLTQDIPDTKFTCFIEKCITHHSHTWVKFAWSSTIVWWLFPASSFSPIADYASIQDKPADLDTLGLFKGLDITETERNAIIKSRVGQGVYRDGLLRLWGGCAVTGYRRPTILLASHIKPWKNCTNRERLDPYNGLLLQPTIDRLFDKGLVSFDERGHMIRAVNVTDNELEWLGVNPRAKLRMMPEATMQYLEYHREHALERRATW